MIDRDELAAALSWIGKIDNSSGQICQIDANGKPTMILFEFGCPACSEVGSKNSEDYGNALVTIVHAAHAYSAASDASRRLRAALYGLVGAESADELRMMEAAMRVLPAPAADKAAMLDAIHALLGE